MHRILRRLAAVALVLLLATAVQAQGDAPTLDVTVNGKPLNDVHYVDRDSHLLFPVLAISQALDRHYGYDPARHVLTVDGKQYPVVLDPALDPPQALEDHGEIYVDWPFLHGIYPAMKIGLGYDGVHFSCILPDDDAVAHHPTELPAEAPQETYWVNLKDRHHYYHTLDCPLLNKDPDKRFEIQDPRTSNVLLRDMYGRSVQPFVPCPRCIGHSPKREAVQAPPAAAPSPSPRTRAQRPVEPRATPSPDRGDPDGLRNEP